MPADDTADTHSPPTCALVVIRLQRDFLVVYFMRSLTILSCASFIMKFRAREQTNMWWLESFVIVDVSNDEYSSSRMRAGCSCGRYNRVNFVQLANFISSYEINIE